MADQEEGPFGEGLQVEVFHAETDREPGDTNWQGYGFDIHPQVFMISAVMIIAFIAVAVAFPERMQAVLFLDPAEANTTIDQLPGFWPWDLGLQFLIAENFGWLFILGANFFIIVCIFFALSKYGKIRLGGVDADKEFSDISWIAMLFSAGMGIGLMFFGVAEPMWHIIHDGVDAPIFGAEPGTQEAALIAMALSYYHWGFHPWAIYGLVGLSLAFFSFNRGLPLTFRSIFWPVLGERIYGWWGHTIDILTVFATLFGLTTSLGLGAMQINAGLDHMFDVGTSPGLQVAIILGVTAIAVVSVALGLKGGVRRLSNLNLILMVGLAIAILVLGPTLFILMLLPEAIGSYLGNFFEFATHSEAFGGQQVYETWAAYWTVFYWAWWIAWSPFVGMFIARISRGRTVREFMLGVLVLPVLFSFVWFAVLGGTAIDFELAGEDISGTVAVEGGEVAMFEMLELLPGTMLLAGLTVLLVTTFFVTSSDSGSLVIDHLTSGGKHDAPVVMRIFWAVTEGLVAAVLLWVGGEAALNALQAAVISVGLPFVLILVFMAFATYVGLKEEFEILQSDEFAHAVEELVESGDVVVQTGGGEVVTDISDATDED